MLGARGPLEGAPQREVRIDEIDVQQRNRARRRLPRDRHVEQAQLQVRRQLRERAQRARVDARVDHPVEPHEIAFLPRLFDLFARPAVWVTGAILVALAGLRVGFGLSGTAAAMVIWAGAAAQAGARIGPNRKMMVMVISLGVALIVGASAHSPSGVVSAILVGAAIFAGFASISLASRRGSERNRSLRDAHRSAYRMYAADIEHEVWEKLRRRRSRSRRAKSGAASER